MKKCLIAGLDLLIFLFSVASTIHFLKTRGDSKIIYQCPDEISAKFSVNENVKNNCHSFNLLFFFKHIF